MHLFALYFFDCLKPFTAYCLRRFTPRNALMTQIIIVFLVDLKINLFGAVKVFIQRSIEAFRGLHLTFQILYCQRGISMNHFLNVICSTLIGGRSSFSSTVEYCELKAFQKPVRKITCSTYAN